MQQIKQFLQGKKTYISAAALGLVAICGFLFGYLGGTETTALLSTAGALAGLGAKSQRTADAIMTALAEVRQVQATSAVGQKIDPKQLVEDIGKALLAKFAQGGLVSSTPAGAVSNVVTTSGEAFVSTDVNPATCFYCGLALSANGGVCDSPLNGSALMTNGRRGHVVVTFAPGGTAK
ncbi:MAG: hypothetical protein ACJ71W_00700 [Terriglobales bacterium]